MLGGDFGGRGEMKKRDAQQGKANVEKMMEATRIKSTK